MSLASTLVADFHNESEATRRVLSAVPAARLAWKPHAKSMSLARLAGHVAEIPGFVNGMFEPEMDFAGAGAKYQPFDPRDTADLLRHFDEASRGLAAALADRDDAFMKATWTMRAGEKVFLSMPRHLAMRTVGLHHLIHHRGQLTVYLRMLEVPVPSTYGPTADVPMM